MMRFCREWVKKMLIEFTVERRRNMVGHLVCHLNSFTDLIEGTIEGVVRGEGPGRSKRIGLKRDEGMWQSRGCPRKETKLQARHQPLG